MRNVGLVQATERLLWNRIKSRYFYIIDFQFAIYGISFCVYANNFFLARINVRSYCGIGENYISIVFY